MDPLKLALIIALLAAAGLAAASLRWVPEGQTHTVYRRGRFHRSLGPGLHLVMPLIDRVTHKISMMGRVLDLHCPPMPTQDAHSVRVDGQIYFQVLDARKASAQSTTLNEAAERLAANAAAGMLAQIKVDAISDRSVRELNSWLLGLMNQEAGQWGVRVTRVDLGFTQDELEPGGD